MANPTRSPNGPRGADPQTYQRATVAALIGLAVQGALTLGTSLVGLSLDSAAFYAAAWHLLGGTIVWVLLAAIYHQHRLERQESLEEQSLTRSDSQAAALFEHRGDDLRQARQRLEGFYRWAMPLVSWMLAGYLLATGVALLRRAYRLHDDGTLMAGAEAMSADSSFTAMGAAAVVAFVAFVVGRYQAGMAGGHHWQLLRAGAGYLMGDACIAGLLLIGALAGQAGQPAGLGYLAFAIPGISIVLGIEIIVAWLANLYRPKRPDETSRPAFDSRLLGCLTSPGSITDAISEAINYQFGFEVSKSWFYQLLGRAVAPLVVLGLAVMIGLSSVVIVAPHERAVVTRYGKMTGTFNATDHHTPRVLGPGIHFKWPWPIGRAVKYPAGRINQLVIGSASGGVHPHRAFLWTNEHAAEEQYLITAPTPVVQKVKQVQPTPPDLSAASGRPADSVSGLALLGAQVAVQYQVSDLAQFLKIAGNPHALVTAIAERRVNALFLTRDVDNLLGSGRDDIGRALRRGIQTDADEYGLGVEIVFVSLVGIHPPAEQGVAAAFLEQIGAVQERQSMIEQARQEAIETLAAVGGDSHTANAIDQAILDLQNQGDPGTDQGQTKQQAIERLIMASRGKAAEQIDNALADRWERALAERAKAERFSVESLAHGYAPTYYRQRQYLDALRDGLVSARKYVVAVDAASEPTYRIDLKDSGSAIDALFDEAGP